MSSSRLMNAMRLTKTGGPEVLEYAQVPIPIPSPTQVLVRHHAIGVNYIDTYHRSGLYKVPLPYIPGREAAGTIEQIGDKVSGLKVGDRVAYAGPNCYGEYNVAESDYVLPLPDSISFEQGAAMMIQGLTAVSLTHLAYPVQKGDTVLIHAAAGGMGIMLTQICKDLGAFVIGTTSTEEKAAVARKSGCDEVILYTQEDFVTRVKEITNGEGVHAVIDGVGASTFEGSLKCLKRLGSMISFGNASGKVPDIDISKLTPNVIRLMRPSLFEFLKNKHDFEVLVNPLLDMIKSKKLRFQIHKVYDLKDIKSAHEDLEGRKTTGKLILKP